MSAHYRITLADQPPVEVELSRSAARGVRRVVEALNLAVTMVKLTPREWAANRLTPEQEAAIDAQMRQMSWRGDV